MLMLACILHEYAFADSLAFSRNARTNELIQSSLTVKGLAHACLTIHQIPDSLPCNPAFIPLIQKSGLGAALLISNGYSNYESVQSLLGGDLTQETVNRLFGPDRILQIEAGADINFISPYLAGRFIPKSIKGFSAVRNEANPIAEVSLFEESGFAFQSGYQLSESWFVGAQLRTLERKFIRKQFQITELATPQGKDLLKAKEQTAFFVDPAISYIATDFHKLTLSFMLYNLGSAKPVAEEINEPVQAQFGLGISPPLRWGKLQLGLDYRQIAENASDEEHLHLGALYTYGAMNISMGIDKQGASVGIFYLLDKVNAGILYSSTRLLKPDEEFYTQTVYLQVGWQI